MIPARFLLFFGPFHHQGHQFPSVAVTKWGKLGDLTKIYYFSVLEAGSAKSRCRQAWFLLEALRDPVLLLSWLLVAIGNPWWPYLVDLLLLCLSMRSRSVLFCMYVCLVLGLGTEFTSAKSLFPNKVKVTFTGSGEGTWTYFCEDTLYSTIAVYLVIH